MSRRAGTALLLLAGLAGACEGNLGRGHEMRKVSSNAELRAALADLTAGVEIVIEAGEYQGGIWLSELSGSAGAPILIRGADPGKPPVFTGGGSEAWHLSDCNHLLLRDLVVRGYAGNGVNVDDGGSFDTPSRGIVIEGLLIESTGPEGNHDALKLSGLDQFTIRACTFRGWGGSAVDMVGCHDGLIEGCSFEGRSGFSQSSGVQVKGGSARVTLRGCDFAHAGARAVNIGGSTGLQYFRPLGAHSEAANILVEGCRLLGSEAPIAFVGAIDCIVRGCSFEYPEKWLVRILQENSGPEFAPCRGGIFEGNQILFDERVKTFVNIGPGTRPETFVYRGNAWTETDAAGRRLASPRVPF